MKNNSIMIISTIICVMIAMAPQVAEAGFSFTGRSGLPSVTGGSVTTGSVANPVLQLISQANANAQGASLPYINQVRASVSPQPDTPLNPLVWDSTLANTAAQWASKCFLNDHSDDYYAGKVGETYTTTSLTQSISFATGIASWASQNVTFSLSENSCFPGLDCSQFRQLAWAKTTKVGCAVNACGSTLNTLLTVCQFFPPGDFDGVSPYTSTAAPTTVTKVDEITGAASVVPLGQQTSKRSTSCTANGKTGTCTAKSQCTAANGATESYYGGGLCQGLLSSNTVCCIYGSSSPTTAPTKAPTQAPTQAPTAAPTQVPTAAPTQAPSTTSTTTPTQAPTKAPTQAPTQAPTKAPTAAPTQAPTKAPTAAPTSAPAGSPLTFPSSQDWRDATGAVTPIKNQGSCGSCWAFSSTAISESQVAIFTGGNIVDLSEQQVLSCTNPGNYNCANGGYPGSALQYAVSNGLVLETQDPYASSDGSCSSYGSAADTFQSSGIFGTPGSYTKTQIISGLKQYGPMVVTVNADNAWQRYSGGVISNTTYTSTNHAVTLVGYDSGADAWIIKNSWGARWGEKGFIRIATTGDFAMTYSAPKGGYSSRIFYIQKTQ